MNKQHVHNPLEGERPQMVFDLQNSSEEQISIIIVHKDRPEHLNICLQSIAVTSFNNNYEIIVVDNASGKDTQDFLDDIESEVKVVRNDKNMYWSAAANKGVKMADKHSKYFVFLHPDVVILNQGWLDLLINVSESTGSGLVGVDMQSYFMNQQKLDFIPEWLMLVTRECWDEAGPFNEKLPLVGHSFLFCMAANQAGFKPQCMRNPIAHHYRIFGVDLNEFERMTEQAMVAIPQLMRELQTVPTHK